MICVYASDYPGHIDSTSQTFSVFVRVRFLLVRAGRRFCWVAGWRGEGVVIRLIFTVSRYALRRYYRSLGPAVLRTSLRKTYPWSGDDNTVRRRIRPDKYDFFTNGPVRPPASSLARARLFGIPRSGVRPLQEIGEITMRISPQRGTKS